MRSGWKKIRKNSKKVQRKNQSEKTTNSKVNTLINNPHWIVNLKNKKREKLTKEIIKKRKPSKKRREK